MTVNSSYTEEFESVDVREIFNRYIAAGLMELLLAFKPVLVIVTTPVAAANAEIKKP